VSHLKSVTKNHRKDEEKSAPAIPCSRQGGQPDVDSEIFEKICATIGPDVLWLTWFARGTCISYRYLGWLKSNLRSDVSVSLLIAELTIG